MSVNKKMYSGKTSLTIKGLHNSDKTNVTNVNEGKRRYNGIDIYMRQMRRMMMVYIGLVYVRDVMVKRKTKTKISRGK